MTPQGTPPKDWSKSKIYLFLTLLFLAITALSQSLMVPPAWNPPRPLPTPEPTPVVVHTPTPTPTPPPPVSRTSQRTACGSWFSNTSQKKYKFICRDQNSFDVYQVNSDLDITKVGSGDAVGDIIDAKLVVPEKGRKAYLQLQLSTDGQRMEGRWHGDDPRESGLLKFQKIPD